MTTLREFLETVDRATCGVFEVRGQLLPMYHIVLPDGQQAVFPAPFTDKDTAVTLVRVLLAELGVRRCAYVDEAWTVSGGDEVRDIEGSLEHYPGRCETIIISAEDADEGVLLGRREILRDGGAVHLGPLVVDSYKSMSGRMVGLLPRSGTTQ